ncbi:response regulator [Phenylobacterium sp.]|jgi:two-component system chemotaxis response regulator CheY|uniref:response regulator n=1 Tax=Phenylobacterium sp. TaxID=1871053 RepID=UPI002F3E81A2
MPTAAAMKVLVVDDQRSIRALVRSSLNNLGCRLVDEAEDGEDAWRRLQARPPHLVISDLNMPKLDGLGLLRAVRSAPQFKNIGFIMLTSRSDAELVQQAIKLGVNNYLMKPFALGALKSKIESVFGPLT